MGEVLGCSSGPEEVGEIGKLLMAAAERSVAEPQRTPEGYVLRLAPGDEVEAALREFARRDKACCPFLDFRIEQDENELRLFVSGPEAAGQVLDLSVAAARVAAASGLPS